MPSVIRIVSSWGLPILLVGLIVLFSILRPDSFPTQFTFTSLANNRSIYALAALAVMIPMTANQFDLSVAGVIGISQILAIGLQTQQGMPWWLACLVVLAIGVVVGFINGVLVTRIRINSFIATLGTGSVLLGILQWYTEGRQVVGSLAPAFIALSGRIGPVPLALIYVIVIGIVLWIVFEYLPFGRKLYVLGENPRAAELNGISAQRYVTIAFVIGGLVSAFAGIVLQAQLRVGQSTVGQEFLLPAFTGALLGATAIKPGRTNVWGTLVAVAVLAVTVAGLNQLGAPFFVEPLFNGFMLIVAVGLSVTAARRRDRIATER
ncbi:ABC transporter permease [Bauldia litoralis]|uniref:ABC transporter permease n=1 Tax=Bauldia litoralis TaxID=665467 RepID=UPI003266D2E3